MDTSVRAYEIHLKWLRENNIEYEVVTTVLGGGGWDPNPCVIKFKTEQDCLFFKLKWE